jgi:hypothetical protein
MHRFIFCADDHVNVIAHDYPGINFKTLVCNAVFDAIN